MDSFLDELRGDPESSGRFTLNIQGALARLGKYQLSEPRLAVLHVVRAAVLSGCGWLRLQTSESDTEAEFPVSLAPSEEIAQLFDWLLHPHSARFQLAVAVKAALSLGRVELTSWDGQQCARLMLSEGRSRFHLGLEPPWTEPRTRVRLVHAPLKEFAERCRWAPLKIRLNGQELAPPTFRSPQLRIYDPTGLGSAGLALAQATCEHRTVAGARLEGPAGSVVGVVSSRPGSTVLVREGVELTTLDLGQAVLSVADLPVDLSCERLLDESLAVVKQRFHTYLGWLQGFP